MRGFGALRVSDHGGTQRRNREEVKILELAQLIATLGGGSQFAFVDRPGDDPQVRCPRISLARTFLAWEAEVSLRDGMDRTIAWARDGFDREAYLQSPNDG